MSWWVLISLRWSLFAGRSSLVARRSSHAQTQRSLALVRQVGDPASFAFRSFAAAFTHADEVHLYYNMSSLIYKGYLLERWVLISLAPSAARAHSRSLALTRAHSFARPHRYPTLKLLLLVLELVVVSSLIYVGVAALVPGLQLMESCAVGFSAVLFGLKVVLQDVEAREHIGAYRNVSWGELLLGQFFSMQYGGMTSMGTAVGIDLERRGLALRASHASTHRRIDASTQRSLALRASLVR